MSIFHNNALAGASGASGGAAGYQIERSLRFNSADSAHLRRDFTTAGNRRTWTWSGWVKRSLLSSGQQTFWGNYDGSSGAATRIGFQSNDVLWFQVGGSGGVFRNITGAVYRDPSAWMHIVATLDTTQATASNRVRLWVNNQLQTFGTSDYPALNYAGCHINQDIWHAVGAEITDTTTAAEGYFNGYLADVHFIDGQALTPSSFGEFDTNNIWQPKAYSGTYGTNGFQLKFADNSNNTATTLGKDTSGNSNNWTPNNLSVTAGAGNDSLVDSPTNYGTDTGTGNEVRGNYCTLNPLDSSSYITLSNGSLDAINPSQGAWYTAKSTFGMSTGKWYWEVLINNTAGGTVGIGMTNRNSSLDGYVGQTTGGHGWLYNGSLVGAGASGSATALSNGDVLGFAFNADAGTLALYLNGSVRSGSFSGLTSGPYFPAVSLYTPGSVSLNAGQRPFAYAAPSGFKALCTQNLPTPTITNGATAMDVKLYTGTGASQTITGLGFSPDFIWTKARSVANSHFLYDVLRVNAGSTPANKPYYLRTDTTAAESASVGITSFDSNGFTLDGNSSTSTLNATYAAWCWDAGSSTVTNTAGSISSQVRANANNGFSVVTYTGTGANATVGHGLGVAPEFLIVKKRSANDSWRVYHRSITASNFLSLDLTDASASNNLYWNNTAPTSTVFSLGTNGSVNGSGSTFVGYCWAPVAGYSAFGSYTGNGSADGPFVFCGFRPRWLLLKIATGGPGSWGLIDSTRSTYNVTSNELYANLADAEYATSNFDFLSNGFKLRTSSSAYNGSGNTFIWAAFAENPFALARAR